MKCVLACVGVLGLALATASAAEWQPAKGPLMTRWAKDVSPTNAHPEYPRMQMVRKEWLNLNGLWDYAIRPKDEPAPKKYDGQILVPYPVESALSGVMKRVDEKSRLWYHRMFRVPDGWEGKQTLLHFGAVDWEATVYLDGNEVGTHRGGYDAFTFEIPAKAGTEHHLVVGVFDPTNSGDQPRGKQVHKPGGIMYTPTTGIWQTAWLEPVPAEHIRAIRIVPDVDAGLVRVSADCVVLGGAPRPDSLEVAVREGEKVVAKQSGPVGKPVEIRIPEPRPWSPDSPFLYDLTVSWGGKDSVESYFGMRKIALGKDEKGITRMMLNGKPLFHIGPLDQGFWPDGLYTAPTDEALRYDVEITRKLGMNCARKHVKYEPDRWYYWCDKLGLMVWQDMPSGNNRSPEAKKQFELELTRMIQGLGNHPCIVMWVPFNEGWGQHDTERYCELVKKLDPTRLVNNASGWADKKVGDVHDIHSYPGPASPQPEPNRAAVLGEFGGLGLGVDGHTWAQKTWGYRGTDSREHLTQQYVKLLRRLYQFKEAPGLCAGIYTQTSDVETECNGLMTYDRAIIKVDLEMAAKANRGEFPPPPEIRVIVPTSEKRAWSWRYTTDKPAGEWMKPDFDDSNWQQGPAGFGTKGTPGSVCRTEWKTSDIWIRREVDAPEVRLVDPHFWIHHDEDVEVYINGVLAAGAKGYTVAYEELRLNEKGRAALKPGRNVLAAHCRQTRGGQYIDFGIVDLVPRER